MLMLTREFIVIVCLRVRYSLANPSDEPIWQDIFSSPDDVLSRNAPRKAYLFREARFADFKSARFAGLAAHFAFENEMLFQS
jgi:hypothetical protein